uniref:DUF3752 domain-containing protein n=1 Tax=Rhodnius prolixus TaxID=13249 RepID=R4FMH0_RHOPR
MARGCSESDSEEERHDRFRSERSNSSMTSKSLYSTGLQQTIKSRSPLRRLNSPSRRDHRSPAKRSRSRSKRRSKERKKSKDRRESKEKSKKEVEKSTSRSSSKNKESRRSDGVDPVKSESSSRRRSRSKGSRRSGSKERKRKRENRSCTHDQADDTFLERFERRRPSVEHENEIVESTVVYRDSSSEPESKVSTKSTHVSKTHKKEKKRKKSHGDAEEGELISEEENNCFGPALPPPRFESEDEDGEVKDNEMAEGPVLPPGYSNRIIGPALPDGYRSRRRSISQEEQLKKGQRISKSDSDEDRKCERTNLIGPTLPFRESLPPSVESPEDDKGEAYGPALPPPLPATTSNRLEDPVIGPLPQGMELDDRVQRILEERAQSLRYQMENKDFDDNSEKKGRETWMLELPDVKTAASIGLGPRKFKTKEGPDMSDRSSWTDTPGSKKIKEENAAQVIEDSRRLEITARNEEMEIKAKKASSHRDKSLLELHQKELKKEKKELESSGGKVERRPFSREIDLQTHKFDEAQKRSIISKAQLLDTRFSCGESKYL